MVKFRTFLILFLSGIFYADCPALLDEKVKVLNKSEYQNLCEYSDNTILIVNTASKCGFTYQYEQLEELYRTYSDDDFVVLGFPSRNFLYQEFDEEQKVEEFCKTNYDISFPLFSLTNVGAANTHPFYKKLFLASKERPRWNFHKYLITKDGTVKSFSHKIDPKDSLVVQAIEDSINS